MERNLIGGVLKMDGIIAYALAKSYAKGDDYVLTPQDKTDIANIVLSELPTTQGVQYGNTSN